MRLVVEPHEVTDLGPRSCNAAADLADHVHQAHHMPLAAVRQATTAELDLLHADDHDDLRRGING
jgi:hypothetical protein